MVEPKAKAKALHSINKPADFAEALYPTHKPTDLEKKLKCIPMTYVHNEYNGWCKTQFMN